MPRLNRAGAPSTSGAARDRAVVGVARRVVRRRGPRPALASRPSPVRRLGQRGDAPADPRRDRDPLFYPLFDAISPVRSLADAGVDDVLSMWSGLGYYRRARALHRAAREVVERFGGELPADADALRSLHGVGPYTAGAIASLAFDLPEALVDGNVARVLARLEGIDAPIDAGPTKGSSGKRRGACSRRPAPGASTRR